MKLRKILVLVLAMVIMLLSCSLTSCSNANTVTIASKDYTENIILGEMFAQLVEANTDLNVKKKLNLGGTFVCFQAIQNGDIDIYPEYTGTALTAELKMDVIKDPDKSFETVRDEFDKQFDIKWFKPLGYNNTYALAVTDEIYQEYKIETYSELAEISENFIFGTEAEFLNRQDGYDGLVETYNMKFKDEPKQMDISLKYQAIGNGEIDVTDAFTTDGAIKQYNLKVLEDDKDFFPPYYVAPIIRKDTLEKHPELEDVLSKLSGIIDEETMMDLNYKVDVEDKDIEKVVKEFLQEKDLID